MTEKEAIRHLINDCLLGIWSDDSIQATRVLEEYIIHTDVLEQENANLKERLEETEQQLAYECGCNAELVDTQNQNEELKQIIKENFDVNRVGVYFKYDAPVMEEEIKKVLNK